MILNILSLIICLTWIQIISIIISINIIIYQRKQRVIVLIILDLLYIVISIIILIILDLLYNFIK